MLYQKNFPKVVWDNGSLTDVSYYMLSFGRDPLDFAFTSTDELYFGRVKPFSAIFVEMAVANTAITALTVEYFNGSAYVPVTGLIDDTQGFTRNGFIQFTLLLYLLPIVAFTLSHKTRRQISWKKCIWSLLKAV